MKNVRKGLIDMLDAGTVRPVFDTDIPVEAELPYIIYMDVMDDQVWNDMGQTNKIKVLRIQVRAAGITQEQTAWMRDEVDRILQGRTSGAYTFTPAYTGFTHVMRSRVSGGPVQRVSPDLFYSDVEYEFTVQEA